ncbi:MAG: DEAD/DEAH box helicase [Desulfobacterales bacterium]|nr:MAG: DEAD/DEAH box helicase [Desulfobacterales bacterium]
MAKTQKDKRKIKRTAKLKDRRQRLSTALRKEKADFFFHEALWFGGQDEPEKALSYLQKAHRLDPDNAAILKEMAYWGYQTKRSALELKGLLGLYTKESIPPDYLLRIAILLEEEGRYEKALAFAAEALARLPKLKIRNKPAIRSALIAVQNNCTNRLQIQTSQNDSRSIKAAPPRLPAPTAAPEPQPATAVPPAPKPVLPPIPVAVEVDTPSFQAALSENRVTSPDRYELTLEGYGIRLRETFDNLISLNQLKDVRSLWYQEETARKVLKSLRGRALLADEVGLGKTIEAGIVFKEYILRGMVKSALILTPTPLVSQWKEELNAKFGLDLPSTDDPAYRPREMSFWEAPFILASINLAKSKNNFPAVTRREYDLVIVDEAHHLKNRNTLNWKLVNALKKRYLLLLTATPVENNLMELYNLITLLKPGQLNTASAFRKEFMTRGDPTDPQNRSKLKDLLGQVMIRNTRAVAKIDIPPRFAQTIRVDSSPAEKSFYDGICQLVRQINAADGGGPKLLLKNLLEEAGSSPRAVSQTLTRLLARNDFREAQAEEMRSINRLCGALDETRKNRILLKLLKSAPGKHIIFVKYLGTLEQLSEFLTAQDIAYALFHGSMTNQRKDEEINSFRGAKDILVTTEIGGEGRNLQFCHQMINYDLPWNPMKIEQRIGRIHRIGQEKEVQIYNLCAAGSVEDHILEILDKKINMFEMVIGEIDMIMGRVRGEQEFAERVFDIWVNARSEEERQKSFDQLATQLKRSKTGYQKTKALDEKLFGENYEL